MTLITDFSGGGEVKTCYKIHCCRAFIGSWDCWDSVDALVHSQPLTALGWELLETLDSEMYNELNEIGG